VSERVLTAKNSITRERERERGREALEERREGVQLTVDREEAEEVVG